MKELFLQQIQLHEKLIYKICHFYANNEADRQDLYQEILIQLWRSYPKFRGECSFNTWLCQVAINTAITGLKKEKKHTQMYDLRGIPKEVEDLSFGTGKEPLYNAMYAAIEQLNEIEKAIVLFFIDGKTYAEIEKILGITEPTLRVKMNRIKQKLRELTKNI
jgi:RNA polymerase sigma-70 factor, ECF subfamily